MRSEVPAVVLSAAVGVLLAVTAGRAGSGDSFLGQPAPEINASAWIGGDGRTELADYRGEAVLLVFWSTHCGPSRDAVRHLSKLQDEHRRSGLRVIALNGESRDVQLRYMVHEDPAFTFPLAVGGGAEYAVKGLPHAYLVDSEGVVAWEGAPSAMSEKKHLRPVLGRVRPPTTEEVESRAARMLAHAERLAEDGLVLRAEQAFARIAKLYPDAPSAAAAAERADAMSAGENEAEFLAQRRVARLVGGAEAPDPRGKRPKARTIEKNTRRLRELADDLRETAPRAALLADEWAEILASPWE